MSGVTIFVPLTIINNVEKGVEIVINGCYGGFGLSKEGLEYYNKISGKNVERVYRIKRDDEFLIRTVKEIGKIANGQYCRLCIDEVPIGYENYYSIEEYDGLESIALNREAKEKNDKIEEMKKEIAYYKILLLENSIIYDEYKN